ncbi:MAG TPA: helicase HerA-like domain-containing protein [Actinomycetales bacterium]|nr:helicase HerA-like domain-containing protein [Actinomycetales bacterium]
MASKAESAEGGRDALVEEIRTGYAVDGPAIELGALVVDGKGVPEAAVRLPLAVLNRHGLVAGATGTGKTKTLQLMAEQLSAQGVPTFLADMKGDLSGMALSGEPNEKITSRAAEVGQQWSPAGCPVEIFTLGGRGTGVPIRATVTSFGPVLLSKVLGLNDVQSSSLGLVFHFADKAGLPMLDLKDLRAVVQYLVSDEGKGDLEGLGGLSKATAGVILRELIAFSDKGADAFFGEPQLDTADLIRVTDDGRGIVNLLELPGVQSEPALFSTFLMWLLADLFESLPEVGDVEEPKLVFFFDEAHLLFQDASKDFLDQIAQTVRLIRSKGVGVFFVTQSPTDVPREVLGQLGSRVQHALRAFTPEDAKALKATASTYPTTPFYDMTELLTSVGTGEAVVTVLSERGAPTPVAWTRLRAPLSLMAPAPQRALEECVASSPLMAEYGTAVDRDSAYERLAKKLAAPVGADVDTQVDADTSVVREPSPPAPESSRPGRPEPAQVGVAERVLESPVFRNFMRSAGTAIGREITRSVFGTGRRRRR